HVVLEQAELQPLIQSAEQLSTLSTEEPKDWQLLCVSAKSEAALARMSDNLTAYLEAHPEVLLADVAYTLHMGRQQFDYRRYMLCGGDGQIQADKKSQVTDNAAAVVFMFPGQGSQYINMAAGLYQHEPLFKEIVDHCAEYLKPLLFLSEGGLDLRTVLYPEDDDFDPDGLVATELAQPALFVCEYALARLLMSWGVEPQVMIGHSLGEYVAACLAGVFSLDDALKLVAVRGRLMQSMAAGEMLGIALPLEKVDALLIELDGNGPVIAAHNAPDQCVVSGSSDEIARFVELLAFLEVAVPMRSLKTSHAFHSPMMLPLVAEFCQILHTITLNPMKIRCISNLTGKWLTDELATSHDYWCEHLLEAVRFNDGITTILDAFSHLPQRPIFVEVGPGRALGGMVRKHPKTEVVNCIRPVNVEQQDEVFLLGGVGQLWLHDVKLDWPGFYAGQNRKRLSLPSYSFDKVRHWLELPG
ncbi:MAG: acyltransferase domain-containing protein, partial [Psychrosphaera sp.]|nr:acyltransferase domain-containing protein [Psychrosphaera sp.]